MAAPTLATNATEAQALAYLSATFKNTYQNSQPTPYNGKNASQIYAYLKSRDPSATPYQLAVATSDLLLSSALTGTIGTAATAAGAAVGDTATGIASASYLPSWAAPLGNLLGDLTSGNLWIRIAEGVLGIVLIAIGLARVTHAVPIATKIAGAVA